MRKLFFSAFFAFVYMCLCIYLSDIDDDATQHFPLAFFRSKGTDLVRVDRINYSNAFAQYVKGIRKPSREVLRKQTADNWTYTKKPPPSNVRELSIKISKPFERNNGTMVIRRIDIRDLKGLPVSGCSFETRQKFVEGGSVRLALCTYADYFNSSYEIRCTNPGSETKCAAITIKLLFCYYHAFHYKPRYQPWNYVVSAHKY